MFKFDFFQPSDDDKAQQQRITKFRDYLKKIQLNHERNKGNANVVMLELINAYLKEVKVAGVVIKLPINNKLTKTAKNVEFCNELLELLKNNNPNYSWIVAIEEYLTNPNNKFKQDGDFNLLLCAFFHYYADNYLIDYASCPKIQEFLKLGDELVATIHLDTLKKAMLKGDLELGLIICEMLGKFKLSDQQYQAIDKMMLDILANKDSSPIDTVISMIYLSKRPLAAQQQTLLFDRLIMERKYKLTSSLTSQNWNEISTVIASSLLQQQFLIYLSEKMKELGNNSEKLAIIEILRQVGHNVYEQNQQQLIDMLKTQIENEKSKFNCDYVVSYDLWIMAIHTLSRLKIAEQFQFQVMQIFADNSYPGIELPKLRCIIAALDRFEVSEQNHVYKINLLRTMLNKNSYFPNKLYIAATLGKLKNLDVSMREEIFTVLVNGTERPITYNAAIEGFGSIRDLTLKQRKTIIPILLTLKPEYSDPEWFKLIYNALGNVVQDLPPEDEHQQAVFKVLYNDLNQRLNWDNKSKLPQLVYAAISKIQLSAEQLQTVGLLLRKQSNFDEAGLSSVYKFFESDISDSKLLPIVVNILLEGIENHSGNVREAAYKALVKINVVESDQLQKIFNNSLVRIKEKTGDIKEKLFITETLFKLKFLNNEAQQIIFDAWLDKNYNINDERDSNIWIGKILGNFELSKLSKDSEAKLVKTVLHDHANNDFVLGVLLNIKVSNVENLSTLILKLLPIIIDAKQTQLGYQASCVLGSLCRNNSKLFSSDLAIATRVKVEQILAQEHHSLELKVRLLTLTAELKEISFDLKSKTTLVNYQPRITSTTTTSTTSTDHQSPQNNYNNQSLDSRTFELKTLGQ